MNGVTRVNFKFPTQNKDNLAKNERFKDSKMTKFGHFIAYNFETELKLKNCFGSAIYITPSDFLIHLLNI